MQQVKEIVWLFLRKDQDESINRCTDYEVDGVEPRQAKDNVEERF